MYSTRIGSDSATPDLSVWQPCMQALFCMNWDMTLQLTVTSSLIDNVKIPFGFATICRAVYCGFRFVAGMLQIVPGLHEVETGRVTFSTLFFFRHPESS